MKRLRWLIVLICLSLLTCYFPRFDHTASAATTITTIDVISYQSESFLRDDEADTSWESFPIVTNMVFGGEGVGTVYLSGTISKEGEVNNTRAFGVINDINIGYSYDGSFLSTNDEDWHLCSDSGLKIFGIDLTKNRGTVFIQKSLDGEQWIDVVEPIADFFSKNRDGNNNLYSIIEKDRIDGTFFA